MVRNVTLNPLNIVLKVSKTSRSGEAIGRVYQTSVGRANLRRLHRLRSAAGQRQGDLFTVETSVFNKDFAGVAAADNHTRQIYAWNIAFVCLRIHRRFFRHWIEFHAQAFNKREVRMISRQKENLPGGYGLVPFPVFNDLDRTY